MSHGPLPEYVDARKAFSSDTVVEGSIELNRLPRVLACLANSDGSVTAALQFTLDGTARRRIQGRLQARLPLVCQRCLEANTVSVDEQVDLVLVNDETQAQTLDKDMEPWLGDGYRIVMADLVEEQLLLGMPIVNYHESGPCSDKRQFSTMAPEAEEENAAQRTNPFAVLAKLKD